MNNLHVKYLLVGGGLASSCAAQAIRELDHDGSLLLIAQEVNRPYHRPPLSKEFLRRAKSRKDLFTQNPAWFEENHVQLRSGRAVAHLDASRMSATLSTGEDISFDKLLIATGASPAPLKIPGAQLPNLFYLRTIDDAELLHHAIDKALREGRPHPSGRGRVAVIGAGVLGVELAASFTQLGLAVDLLLAHDHPWHKFAGENTARFLSHYLEKRGITLRRNAPPQRLEGDGRVQRIVLPDGQAIPCDFAIAAVGAIPNKDLVHNTPIAAARAILTDAHCQTNVPGIFAAGDCAAVLDPLFAKHRVLDHWDNAQVTGRLAGRNMAGAAETYTAVNNFFSDVFDLTLNGWGDSRHIDRRLIRGTPNTDSPDFLEFGLAADNRIVQILSIGHPADADILPKLIATKTQINGNEERLKDPTTPLADLLQS